MTSIADIYQCLAQYEGLAQSLTIEKIMDFIRLGTLLKEEILALQRDDHDPADSPSDLPANIRQFLSSATEIQEAFIDGCWGALREVIWNYDANAQASFAFEFEAYGHSNTLSKSFLCCSRTQGTDSYIPCS